MKSFCILFFIVMIITLITNLLQTPEQKSTQYQSDVNEVIRLQTERHKYEQQQQRIKDYIKVRSYNY